METCGERKRKKLEEEVSTLGKKTEGLWRELRTSAVKMVGPDGRTVLVAEVEEQWARVMESGKRLGKSGRSEPSTRSNRGAMRMLKRGLSV